MNYGKHLTNLRKIVRKRPVLTNEYRQLIYDTYNKRCAYCGDKVSWQDYEADHIIPFSKNGITLPHNMCCSCRDCNRSKGTKLWERKYIPREDKLMAMYITYYTQGHFSIWHVV